MRRYSLSKKTLEALYTEDLSEFRKLINEENINWVDKDGRPVIFHAILDGSQFMLLEALKFHPDLNLKDNLGWTALHYAAQNFLIEIAKILVDKGADVNGKDNFGNSILWRAVFASKGRGEMIKLLLENGAKPDEANSSGVTPLKLAVSISNYNISQYF